MGEKFCYRYVFKHSFYRFAFLSGCQSILSATFR